VLPDLGIMAGETPVTEVRKGGMVAEKACLQQQPNLNFSALLQSRRLRGLEMRFIVLLCAAALLLAVPVSLNAEQLTDSNTAPSAAEAELLSLANAWTEAINAKNRSKLQELMASEFTLHAWDDSWQVARAEWLENLFHSYDIKEYHHSAMVPHVYGDVAMIASRWYWHGARGAAEKKPFEEHGYVVDVWRRKGGRWQVVSRITVVLPGKEEPFS